MNEVAKKRCNENRGRQRSARVWHVAKGTTKIALEDGAPSKDGLAATRLKGSESLRDDA